MSFHDYVPNIVDVVERCFHTSCSVGKDSSQNAT